MGNIVLRDYQQDCLKAIEDAGPGSHLIVMATGLGKTVVFSRIPRKGRTLILSHREELVYQPLKYFDVPCGVEKAEVSSHGEEVVSASVQSLIRRLHRFDPNEFDMIITDEAHHAAAESYKKIYAYFHPRVHLGFTATPDRADKKDLNEIFNDIIFYRDVKWGVKKKFLCDVECMQVDIGYDLSKARKLGNDYNAKDIEQAIDQEKINNAISEVYNKYAKGQTLIFASSVKHAHSICERIPGAVAVTAETKGRDEIIQAFTDRKIPCIVNCGVFTEGTDIPLIETIIMARPTSNQSLYMQMAGRGLRPYPGKANLRLVDCVGVSGKLGLRTACDLFGINAQAVPKKKRKRLNGCMLSEMEDKVVELIDGPDAWVLNDTYVDAFADENDVDFRDVDWCIMPDDSFLLSCGSGARLIITTPDALNRVNVYEEKFNKRNELWHGLNLQVALNNAYAYLNSAYEKERRLWDKRIVSSWGREEASQKQMLLIYNLMKNQKRDLSDIEYRLTKGQANKVIDRLLYESKTAGKAANA